MTADEAPNSLSTPNPSHRSRKLSKDERKRRQQLTESKLILDVEVLYGDIDHLKPIGVRPPLTTYLRALYSRRYFIWQEARSKASTQNSNDKLGSGWLILRPLLDAAFYWLIFGLLLDSGRDEPNYVAFILIGVLMFRFTSKCLNGGASVMKNARAMLRAFSFPRASIPIALLIREFLLHVPVIATLLVAIWVVPPHAPPTWTWLLAPVVLIAHVAINLGLIFMISRIGARLPDIAQAMSFVIRIAMYCSGVIFPIERFIQDETALTIVKSNPIYVLLDSYRSLLIHNSLPSVEQWLLLGGWSAILLTIGFLMFWSGEKEYSSG